MSSPILEVHQLTKDYTLGGIGAGSLRDELTARWDQLRGRKSAASKKLFRALDDINFNLQPGEILGVIGHNGAGKSTLLKILSRITEPTAGEAILRGRVSSLLEVGTGFHPELSGRENVFLSGAVLGMTRAEIASKFDDIVGFAMIEKFIDTPVKRYSSGMSVRLGFAIAAHLEPEILIIDEVLAVGDIQFQKKCLGKMENASRQGRTILFVSHHLGMIRQLCTRCLLLDKGRLRFDGSTAEAIHNYYGAVAQKETYDFQSSQRTDSPSIKRLSLRQEGKAPADGIKASQETRVFYELTGKPSKDLITSIEIRDEEGQLVFHSGTDYNSSTEVGSLKRVCMIPRGIFNTGEYTVDAFLMQKGSGILCSLYGRLSFSVYLDDCESRHERWKGINGPSILQWDSYDNCP